MSSALPPAPTEESRPPWRSVAVGVAIVVLVVLAFVLLRGGDDGGDTQQASTGASGTTAARPKPVSVTPAGLAVLAKTLKRPLYWVGPAPAGSTYELTQAPMGAVYVRYLDRGVALGDPRPNFLTVGTYAQSNPFKTVTDAAKAAGARSQKLSHGGVAFSNKTRPDSWYVAYPDGKSLIEVYSPKAGRAGDLVRTGRVVPVKG